MNENSSTRSLEELLPDLYMKYAKSVIVARSMVLISGLKPVQQRVLYAMNELKAKDGTRRKCARIVGDTMGMYHPHGDSSIYGALVTMVDSNESLNAPWIKGQGNLGKVWAKECIRPAAMRYTEAQLSKLATEELFRGINEGAVPMVDNFDTTEKEPMVLPVSFPSILVNSTSGIAVGISHNIPTYTLNGACAVTKYVIQTMLNKEEIDIDTFVDTLGAPDFRTGGTMSISRAQLRALANSGNTKGVYLTGACSVTKSKVSIIQIPYTTNVEKVLEEVRDLMKSGDLPGVRLVENNTGNGHMGIGLTLTKGADPEEVIRILKVLTSFRVPISYSIKFINYDVEKNDFDYKECGAIELLRDYWIPWRVECIRNVYKNKIAKLKAKCHEAEAWEIVQHKLDDVIKIIRGNKRAEGKQILMSKLGLDLIQANYMYSRQLSSISEDSLLENLDVLKKDRLSIDMYTADYLVNDIKILKEICEDQDRVSKKYGTERNTNVTTLQVIEDDKEALVKEEKIIEGPAWVGVTSKGYIKRTMDEDEAFKLEYWAEDAGLEYELECENTDTLLIFTNTGFCYKLPVYRIEDTRGEYKESIWKLVERFDEDGGEILSIHVAKDYSERMTILYSNGEGIKLNFKAVSGPRQRYRSLFSPINGQTGLIYNYNEFFIVTQQGNAAWVDLNYIDQVSDTRPKMIFKLPRIKAGDSIKGFVAKDNIKYFDRLSIERFKRDYCVKVGADEALIYNITYNEDMEREKAIAAELAAMEALNNPETENENDGTEENGDNLGVGTSIEGIDI